MSRQLWPVALVVSAALAHAADRPSLAFYLLLAWAGYSVMEILATDHLVSLPKVSVAVVQSVIPISAVLFVIAQLMVVPAALDEALRGDIVKAEELI